MRQISRIEDDQTHTYAWLVRVQRRNQVHHRYFSDRVYSGTRQALVAATAYRETLLQTLPGLTRQEICRIRKKKNRLSIISRS